MLFRVAWTFDRSVLNNVNFIGHQLFISDCILKAQENLSLYQGQDNDDATRLIIFNPFEGCYSLFLYVPNLFMQVKYICTAAAVLHEI